MYCFCFQQIIQAQNNLNLYIKFTDINPTDTKLYCNEMIQNLLLSKTLQYGYPILVSIINIIVCTITIFLSNFEKRYTKNEQTVSIFSKITVLQYFNIAITSIFVNFNLNNSVLKEIGIF